MFGLFSRKKEIEQVREDTKKGFESVKKDISAVSGWIKHLDSEKEMQKKDIEDIKEDLSSIMEEMESLKNVFSLMNELKPKQVFKTPNRVLNKQTAVFPVQTDVQTDVQTPNLEQFSVTERAILWILLNSDMKLSYDDLAAMLGKERSTIRGQINTIKSKSESLIEEVIEKNGKKRVYIPDEIKEKMLKKAKVRVNKEKNKKKSKKVSEY
jgi:predicted transcriptional regulator